MTDEAEETVTCGFDQPIERRDTCSIKWGLYGPDVLPLWVADMDFAAPPPVLEALRDRLDHGVIGYGMAPQSLTDAICDYQKERYGWQVRTEWLVFLPSAVPALNLVCKAFAAPGEAVMMITPAYPPFLSAPRYQGREAILVPSERIGDKWRLPLEQMEAAVTPATRVLLFCHPHNPIGRVWRRDEVEAVVGFCRRHGLVLCSDEIHSELVLDDLPHLPAATFDGASEFTVTVTSPSKAYNLAGLGFSYAVIPDWTSGGASAPPARASSSTTARRCSARWHARRRTATEACGWRSCSTTCAAIATWSSGSWRSGCRAFS